MPLPDLHPDLPDERLEQWLDGDLPAPEAAQVADAVCRYEAWADAAVAARHTQAVLRATPRSQAPPHFAASVIREVAQRERAGRSSLAERVGAWWRVPVWQPALALAVVVFAALVVAWPRPAAPSDEEIAQTLEDVRWTLAYLSNTSEKTGLLVRDRVIAPHVVAPVRQALGTSTSEIDLSEQ